MECPYGDKECPKIAQLEERVDRMEHSMERTADTVAENSKLLQYLMGMVMVGFGLTGGLILW